MDTNRSGSLMGDLLRLLADGGLHSTAEIARGLAVSPALLAMMTDALTRRGYLAAVDGQCGAECAGCGVKTTCQEPGAASPLLSLTARGQRAARKR